MACRYGTPRYGTARDDAPDPVHAPLESMLMS